MSLKVKQDCFFIAYTGLTPLASKSPEADTTVRATGWGKISDDSFTKSPVLRFIDVSVMSESNCKSYYPGYITDGHICIDSIDGGVCNVSFSYFRKDG